MEAEPVDVFDERIVQLSVDLTETAKTHNAEGLAAIQIGVLYKAFVIKDGDEFITCINPEILDTNLEVVHSKEGCLSFPGVNEVVRRFAEVHVKYQDETGAEHTRWLSGTPAVAFQHELDHLRGVLFIDLMGKLQKRAALKKLRKVMRRTEHQMENIQKMLAHSGVPARV